MTSLQSTAVRLYHQNKVVFWEMVRFGVVGFTSVGVYTVAMFGFVKVFGVAISIATIPSYMCSMLVNYTLQKIWTFSSTNKHVTSVPKYLTVQAIGLVINFLTVAFFIRVIEAPYLLGQIAAVGLIAVWSYGAQKFWVFAKEKVLSEPD